MMNTIQEAFGFSPIFTPVIHYHSDKEFWRSVDIAVRFSDGIWLINQGNTHYIQILELAEAVRVKYGPCLFMGVNFLFDNDRALGTVSAMGGVFDGLWVDNARINEIDELQIVADSFVDAIHDSGWKGLYFGGTAFKYQGRVDNLRLVTECASRFMHVVTTSGPGTGRSADLQKIKLMSKYVDQAQELDTRLKEEKLKPSLALASGVSIKNVHRYLPYVDAFLVGTSIEDEFGVLNEVKTKELYLAIRNWRLNNKKSIRLDKKKPKVRKDYKSNACG